MGDRQPPNLRKAPSPLAIKLTQAIILGRWLMVLGLWLTCGTYAAWGLRAEYVLWRDHLTWASVRYGLAYNPVAALCLVLCIAYTCAVAAWHSQKILQGWSAREMEQLEKQAFKISRNPRHWLWFILKKI